MKNWLGGKWAWVCIAICLFMGFGAIQGYRDGYVTLGFVAPALFMLALTAFITRKSWY